MVSLCKRHTNISRFCPSASWGCAPEAIPRSKGKLPRASPGGQSPEVVILLLVRARPQAGLVVTLLPNPISWIRDPALEQAASWPNCHRSFAQIRRLDRSSLRGRIDFVTSPEWKQAHAWHKRMQTGVFCDGNIRRY